MKEAAKFALIYFSLSTLLVIVGYLISPSLYPGDSFLIVWMYAVNILVGIVLFPFISIAIRQKIKGNSIIYLIFYFIGTLIIVNIIPLVTEHVFYIAELIKVIFRKSEMQKSGIFELVDLVLSFGFTCLIFRKSALWYPLPSSQPSSSVQ